MAMNSRNPIAVYRAGPRIDPSAQIDAAVLGAARATPAMARGPRVMIVATAAAAAVAAVFYIRVATTPPQDFASTEFGREEGLTRVWLTNLDLHTPTGPGSQEGLP
jgi:hypothetical protein